MRIILLGGPGAGKGTQAQYLANYLNIPLVTTGNMLRSLAASGSELGLRIKLIMEQGELVADEVIVQLVKERIRQADCSQGYLLDGFPRTINQAEALALAGVKIDLVIEIAVSDDEIVTRLSGRRIHLASGRTYHLQYNQPKISGLDDLTNEVLIQRKDDNEEVVRERLRVYHEKTKPLINYYQSLANQSNTQLQYFKVDGAGEIARVRERLLSLIGSFK